MLLQCKLFTNNNKKVLLQCKLFTNNNKKVNKQSCVTSFYYFLWYMKQNLQLPVSIISTCYYRNKSGAENTVAISPIYLLDTPISYSTTVLNVQLTASSCWYALITQVSSPAFIALTLKWSRAVPSNWMTTCPTYRWRETGSVFN